MKRRKKQKTTGARLGRFFRQQRVRTILCLAVYAMLFKLYWLLQ